MARKKLDNPLTSLNIPQPPKPTVIEDERVQEHAAEQTSEPAPRQQPRKPETDKATLQLSTYFTIAQYVKLQDFEKEYLRMTGRKTDPNKILRKLVEKAVIDDIL